MKYILLYSMYIMGFVCTLAFIVSCKKDRSNNPGNSKKIASMIVNNRNVVYSYDAQGRLQRIDNGVDFYTTFEHSAVGIVMQQYNAAGDALPAGRRQFNVVNGRIVSAKENTSNNGLFRNHYYGYDSEGRLIQHIVREVFEPSQQESRSAQFLYTYTGSNASRVTYLYTNGDDAHASDSVSIELTYYEDKKFYTYANIGFGYFGTVSVGMQHQGQGILSPISGLISLFEFPANNPIKSKRDKLYRWNLAQKRWDLNNTGGYDIPETNYEYDAAGNLIKCGSSEIKWQ